MAVGHLFRQRRIRQFMRDVLPTSEKTHIRPPKASRILTQRATQHRITVLKRLQDKLPRKVQPTVTLAALAGQLTPQQLVGVEYYLAVRFKVK